ncbi:hypothetical protein [uncultured Ruegeria sp.]|uniref:hypothetical protein n=1 Tax=uncultured Ruegeria sp. TaxID=259304 RepID=UPI002624E7C0|nr:hypothetical protein [uncultured Ruegeria sp.]
MSPEVRAILKRIGYERAMVKSGSLFLGSGFDNYGGLAFNTKIEARDALEKLERLERALLDVPERVIELWDHHSRRSEDWDAGRNVLADVIFGLRGVIEFAENTIGDPQSKKYGRNHSADAIAYNMAEIYVLGMGEVPDGKARSSEGKPTGDYTKAVQAMFDELGVKSVSFRQPCERAVKRLVASGHAEFLLKSSD